MLKALTMAILVAGLAAMLGTNEAAAKRGAKTGICPVRCAKAGSTYAKNINNCSVPTTSAPVTELRIRKSEFPSPMKSPVP
jgi:hypothetical protein